MGQRRVKKVVALIQVRMKSTRLPRKALCLIEDKPMIEHVIARLKHAETPREVAICTSTHPDDRVLVEIAEKNKIGWFTGSEEDVLARFIQAAEKFRAEVVIRASGEDPMVDPAYLDVTVRQHLAMGAEYTSAKGLPSGVGIEVMDKAALEKAYKLADNPELSEYMTLYFRDDFFRVHTIDIEEGLRRPQYRLTVDTPEDLTLMRKVYEALYRPGQIVSLREAVALLDSHPELVEINRHRTPRQIKREVLLTDQKPKIRITEV